MFQCNMYNSQLPNVFTVESSKRSSAYVNLLKSLNENFDLSTSCGYVTLLNIAARKRTNLQNMPNIKTLASDGFDLESIDGDVEDGIVMNSPVTKTEDSEGTGEDTDKDRLGALGNLKSSGNLSNGIVDMENGECASTVEKPPQSPLRGKLTSSSSMDHLAVNEHWVVLQISYGLPLFDSALNREICSKVGGLFSLIQLNYCWYTQPWTTYLVQSNSIYY